MSLNWKTLIKVGLGYVWKAIGHNFGEVLEFDSTN